MSNFNPFWSANGADALVDLSRLTNLVVADGYVVQPQAHNGGRVNLPGLESLFTGAVQVLASGTDSVVDLSSLSGFVNRFSASSSLTAQSGGVILLPDDAFLLANVQVNISDHPVLPPTRQPPAKEVVLFILAADCAIALLQHSWKSQAERLSSGHDYASGAVLVTRRADGEVQFSAATPQIAHGQRKSEAAVRLVEFAGRRDVVMQCVIEADACAGLTVTNPL